MAMACKVCNHSARLDIDKKLARGISVTKIAKEFNCNPAALINHRDRHLSRQLVTAVSNQQLLENTDILSEITDLIKRTKKILKTAEDKEDYNLALSAVRETRGSLELMSKIAFSFYMAKAAALELETLSNPEYQRQTAEISEKQLQILSPEELELYFKLNTKIITQNPDSVLPEPETEEDMPFKRHILPSKAKVVPSTQGIVDNGVLPEELAYLFKEPKSTKRIPFESTDHIDPAEHIRGIRPIR